MNFKNSIKTRFSQLPKLRIALVGAFLGWLFLSTVIPIPAPPGDGGGDPPN